MTTIELLKMAPTEGIDRWLFSGQLVERWNGFHSPAHSAMCAKLSAILFQWSRASSESFRVYGYGCPYLLKRNPDTYLSYDLSVVSHFHPKPNRDVDYLECPPLLAIEIKELDEDEELLMRTIECSLRLGAREMWSVDPFEEIVVCHSQHTSPKYINGGMDLVGGSFLPNFRYPVKELFE